MCNLHEKRKYTISKYVANYYMTRPQNNTLNRADVH